MVFSFFKKAKENPINDIVTDVANPPVFIHGDLEAHSAKVGEIQQKTYPDGSPHALVIEPRDGQEVDAAAVHRAVLQLAKEQERWTVVAEDEAQRMVQAVAVTKLFRFRDDIVFHVRDVPPNVEVHARSKSRVGKSDLGVNRARIIDFLGKLKSRL